MRLFISQEEIVVCGTFASGGAQCHGDSLHQADSGRVHLIHSAFSLQAENGHEIITKKWLVAELDASFYRIF
jgi:hypothetical protein